MTPVFVFGASFALLLAFFALKAVEVRRGSRFAAPVRARFDARILHTFETVRTLHLSDDHKRMARATARYVAHQLVVKVLELVRKTEARLAHVADVIRGKRVVVAHATAPSSPFLETIVEHKNAITKSAARRITRSRKKKADSISSQDLPDAFSMPIPQPE